MLAEWFESKDGKQRFLSEDEAKAACGKDYVSKSGKMSKSLRNYRSPNEIFDKFGADALRWYFYANQPPWNSILYSERAIRDSISEFMLRLWNVFSFFTIYAEIDGFAGPFGATDLDQLTPQELARCKGYRPISQRSELDRWMISELHGCIDDVRNRMDRYDSYGACQSLNDLVDAMSNWYVRRSRNRYWAEDKNSPDKIDAYWTLYECMVSIAKMMAPFTPFLSESLWRQLTGGLNGVRESIHLCDYPVADQTLINRNLSVQMKLLREIASLGRSARMESRLKVRQPLSLVEVTLVDATHADWLKLHDEIVREELNVKEIHYGSGSSPHIQYEVLPNFKVLGPKVGSLLPKLKGILGKTNGADLLEQLNSKGAIQLDIDGKNLQLDTSEVQVRLKAKDGWAAAQGKQCVVVLETELTDELIQEGIARDAIRLIQDQRKKQGCNFTDRIAIGMNVDDDAISAALRAFEPMILAETLGVQLKIDTPLDGEPSEVELGDKSIRLSVKTVSA
jgi:isoleucyl-tRNA synthetase